jgi:hypothetical protein
MGRAGKEPGNPYLMLDLAPRAGFEPATIRLTVECSTAELPGNGLLPEGLPIDGAGRLAKRAERGLRSCICKEIGGHARNRTGVQGFAVLCVTTPPRGLRPAGPPPDERALIAKAHSNNNGGLAFWQTLDQF